MLSKWIRLWVSAGTHHHKLENDAKRNLSPIYVTNLICLVVCLFLLVQLPFYLWSASLTHQTKSVVIALHVLALILVPLINGHNKHFIASILLYCIYSSYILCSSLVAHFQADTHLFFLLGLFIIPFIFSSKRASLKLALSSLYICLFFAIEWYQQSHLSSWPAEDNIRQINRLIFAITCFVAAFQVHKITTGSWAKMSHEKANLDSLLSNILPCHIISKLKKSDKTIAHYHPNVTILFADIQNFTKLTCDTDPIALVKLLDELFSLFDEICSRYQLEKIKTLGDGYMVVAGLHENTVDHPKICCICAQEMHQAYKKFSQKHGLNNGIRIGINSGPVVAGVIGRSKYTFDVWGEAVNLASRMQSYGETDKIQVSETTYVLTRTSFNFSPRRTLEIKGMGEIDAYWLLND
ncbi:adenylate/guanylate cyclase domain-containing protein [Alteromonadaceae bacterium M269]|nr:adenylate/guanylate cyclase domain-containing protein [Alteromonadaceae bacterium M269]